MRLVGDKARIRQHSERACVALNAVADAQMCIRDRGYAAPMLGEDFDYIVDHGDVPPGAEFAVRIRDDSLEPVLHGGSVAYLNQDVYKRQGL